VRSNPARGRQLVLFFNSIDFYARDSRNLRSVDRPEIERLAKEVAVEK
jgi:hypothetical protein